MAPTFSRRHVLALGAATGLAPLLGACGDGSPSSPNSSTGSVKLPTYKPVTAATPDLAAEPAGVSPGYFTYPTASSAASQPVQGAAILRPDRPRARLEPLLAEPQQRTRHRTEDHVRPLD
jgi:hypothetical protein